VPDRDPGRPEHRPDRLAGHLRPVNEFGFIETPYRKVVERPGHRRDRLPAADEEEEYVVAQANAPLNADGTFAEERVLCAVQAASLKDGELERDVFFGATTGSVPPRGRLHGRLAAPDRVGRRPR
jgi:hypothetical protein